MTISLPTDWESDAAVTAALSIAGKNGWVITVQSYGHENGAAMFRIRRSRTIVWCRKVTCSYGAYVDTDGNRQHIEWCSTIFSPHGNNPTLYGYEPFDSTDAAVKAWQLSLYQPQENNSFE